MKAKKFVSVILIFAVTALGTWAETPVAMDASAVAAAAAANPELAAQAADQASKLFGFTFDLGVDTLPVPGGAPEETETYQRFGFKPELNLGPFGVGLDLTLRAQINLVGENPIEVYMPDWIPNYMGSGTTILDVYLPKILFVRYGQRGGPLYAKLGSIEDLTIGNGFIMGNYSNTRFLPERRIFGLGIGLDGSLFKFPYFGLEFATGNLSRMDVLGGRAYIRPLAFLSLPLLKGLEFGYEQVIDLQPYLYGDSGTTVAPAYSNVYGVDARAPILPKGPITMTAMGDLVFQEGDRMGAMAGLSGRIIGIFPYAVQLRYLEDGFIPVYFDSNYDLYRAVKHDALSAPSSGEFVVGWYANAGASLFSDKVSFSALMDGPFAPLPAAGTGAITDYPHLKAVLGTAEGLLAGFSVNAAYEKYFLGASGDFWDDLFSPENAQIQAGIGYKTGPAVISLVYNVRYDPLTDTYDTTSSLQTSVKY
jgi:hypothetical protein